MSADYSFSVLNALPHPVILVAHDNNILFANLASESFFQSSINIIQNSAIESFIPFSSPILALIEQVRDSASSFNEYKIDVSSPRLGNDLIVDVYASPCAEFERAVVLQLLPRSVAEKIDRQLNYQSSVRTVSGLAAMLGHEIKNPLSGIRGAAQLLEMSADSEDRSLTQLIKEETDRIVKLVDRMEVFSDERPVEKTPVNIHAVLERVKNLAVNGFAKQIAIVEKYDPSLPFVHGSHDQLVQIFLNLVKNAAEALSEHSEPEICLETGYRPGIHMSVQGAKKRVSLPLELIVRDNGGGISEEIRPHIFDPFVTTKTNGSGLGLALVAKIVSAHGGVIECESDNQGTLFRILLPVYKSDENSNHNIDMNFDDKTRALAEHANE